MSKNKTVATVFRWIAVLPAALLATVAVAFPVHWFVMLINSSPSADGGRHMLSYVPPEMLQRFGLAYFGPLVFIMVGAYVAPRFKLATAAALAGLLAGSLLMAQLVLNDHLSAIPLWQRGITWTLWAVAIAVALVVVRQNARKRQESSNVTGWN